MKKRIIIICIALVAMILCGVYYISHNNEKKQGDTLEEREDKNSKYCMCLHIGGEYEVSLEDITFKNKTTDEAGANIYISYYNYENNEDISYEMLMDEYDNFAKNSGEYENLKKFSDFIQERCGVLYYEINEDILVLSDYVKEVQYCLESKGKSIAEASVDDIRDACYSVLAEKTMMIYRCKASYINNLSTMYAGIDDEYCDDDISSLELVDGCRVYEEEHIKIYYASVHNAVTGEEQWKVIKVELLNESAGNILTAGVGEDRDTIVKAITDVKSGCQFTLVNEDDDLLEFSNGEFLISAEMEEGICVCLSLEAEE